MLEGIRRAAVDSGHADATGWDGVALILQARAKIAMSDLGREGNEAARLVLNALRIGAAQAPITAKSRDGNVVSGPPEELRLLLEDIRRARENIPVDDPGQPGKA